MQARTGEERFATLWRESAGTLLARRDPDGLWTQDFAGHRQRFRARHGRGRYSLFTGDSGAALLAAAILNGDARFPGLDVL